MPYPTLPPSRRIHYEIDGSVVGWNLLSSLSAGMRTIATAAQMLSMNEETPTAGSSNMFTLDGPFPSTFDSVYVIFPELRDLSFFMARGDTIQGSTLQGSVDTTNGTDGTWVSITLGAGTQFFSSLASDWWRSTAPKALTGNNTGLKGIRFIVGQTSNTGSFNNLELWGTKHTGQTPDDIIFIKDDAVTEWPNDDDWGDVQAGTGFVTHTYYVKNTSSLTAHSVTVKSSGSDNARWTVSLDNASFASSQPIASLAPGASQVVYAKFTIPAGAAGNYRPYAAYIEADVASWS